MKATRVGFVACVAALAAAAPAHATYGGRAGLVTFDSSAGHSDGSLSLFVQSPLEGGARELFADRESAYGRRPSDSDASWSRSGRRFVFARYGLVRSRIYVAHANGSHLREVPLPSNVHAEDPALGPDGKTVAYVQVAPGDPNDDLSRGEESVHVARLDGSHRRAIGAGAEPTWTPDGRILYSGPGAQCARLVLVRPNGTRRRAITSGKKVHGRCQGGAYPDVSPDGKRIAFTGDHLVTMRIDGTHRHLVPGTRGAYTAAWSPTGSSIAYFRVSSKHSPESIRLTTPDGRQIRRLAGHGGLHVAWQRKP